jgi:hypothetical protein
LKKFFKIALGIVGGFVALGIIIGVVSGGGSSEPRKTTTPMNQEAPKAEVVSQENFDKIVQGDSVTGEGGMTIDEVKAILGEPDSTSESQSGDLKMEMYSWTKNFKTISVTFSNGKVSYKGFIK